MKKLRQLRPVIEKTNIKIKNAAVLKESRKHCGVFAHCGKPPQFISKVLGLTSLRREKYEKNLLAERLSCPL